MKNLYNQFNNISEQLRAIILSAAKQIGFPVEVFPKALQEIISKVSEGRGMHVDHLSSAILFAFAYSIGNKNSISVFENTARLKPILYMIFIAPAGRNKSSALKFSMSWFYQKDKEYYLEYKKDLDAYETWLELDPKERAQCPKIKPIRRQSIFKDATLEALGDGLAKNPRGIAQIRDEIAGFFKDLNKYRAGSDVQNYLEMWSQDPVILNRVSKESAPIIDPFLLLAGTIQPKVLGQSTSDILMDGSGHFDRFLYSWPERTKKPLYKKVDLKLEIQSYEETLSKVYDYNEVNIEEQRNFLFSPKAEALILEWLNCYNNHLVDNADEEVASLYSKLDIHLQRICLILHFIGWAFDDESLDEISEITAINAIRLIEFFRGQSEKVLEFLMNSEPELKLKSNHLELFNKLPQKFTSSEGLKIAEEIGFSKRNFYYFLSKNTDLIKLVKAGFYEKI